MRRYNLKKPLPFSGGKVYRRSPGKFSQRDISLDAKIIAGPMKNRIGGKNDPYAHTHDEFRLDRKHTSSGVKARGIRKGWSTWDDLENRKAVAKKLVKEIRVKKNRPTALKPRKKHDRKRPWRR